MENLLFLLIIAVFVGAASGYVGSFMVLKRMALVGDALSHVALPGMAIALMFHLSPILGAFAALFLAIVGVWYFSEKSSVYPETLVGIFFTFSLALGILITPEPELLEALFGTIEKITPVEGTSAIVLSIIIIFVTRLISEKIILGTISEDLAKTSGVKTNLINLIYLLLVGAVVAIGVRFIGTLLMGALVIIPAASAKNLGRGIHSYHYLSVFFGVLSAILGITIASFYHLSVGPIVVLVSILIFLFSFVIKNIKT